MGKQDGRAKMRRGFTLLELLVVIAIVGVLVALLMAALPQALFAAGRADSASRMRSMGQAIFTSVADRQGLLPGPLWPGQVLVYDDNPRGRLVSELADYLQVERRAEPYLVQRMIPRSYLAAMRDRNLNEARVYVVNKAIDLDGETLAPFGALGAGDVPLKTPLPLARFAQVPENERWMLAEADQRHPDVSTAPWSANTPPEPLHDNLRGLLRFDGSVAFEKP